MGETAAAPEVTARAVEDLTKMEVDPSKCERLYKAALIHSNKGTTYRMLAKSLQDGRLDIIHYGCMLDENGTPTTKWSIRRILEQKPERFEKELESIKQTIRDSGEEVHQAWVHDLTTISDVSAQGVSLEAWTKKIASDIKAKLS